MPLIKGAKPGSKGFKENIKREMAAKKPQRQAVAIAYSESGQHHNQGEKKMHHKEHKGKEHEAHKEMHKHHKEMHKHHCKEMSHHEKMMKKHHAKKG